MALEMESKHLELRRITQVVSILLSSGLSRTCVPRTLAGRCVEEQHSDGGWGAVPDTAWNLHFLEQFDAELYRVRIALGTAFLLAQRNARGLWGRSKRDIERIPVTGLLLYLFPQLATRETMRQLELLWVSERNGLTYKAAYTLLSFKRNNYEPNDPLLIESTVNWLVDNQRDNGGFAPWKAHPVASDVYCTAVAALGLLQYRELVPRRAFERCLQWLESSQLPQGIWAFHEIEDGASWGLWALIELSTFLAVE
jgi:hypothetical protein